MRLAPANPPAGPGGYPPPPGTPFGYNDPADAPPTVAPPAYSPPGGYGSPPGGYQSPQNYGSPSGPVPSGPVPGGPVPGGPVPGGPVPGGYQQGQQYGQGQYQPPGYPQPGYPQRSSSSGLPPVNFDLSRLTTVDRVVAGATLVTMISLWLPWFSASYMGRPSGSISGTGDHGFLWLEFVIALALLAYFAARGAWAQLPFKLPVTHEWLLIGATGLQFLLILGAFLDMPSSDGVAGFSISWDVGAFLALIASIVATAPVSYPAVKAFLDSRKAAGPRSY